MRIGSLFSGYGGLDMAVQSVLGGDLAWYSEIEPAACTVLAAHHPGVPNLGDITAVDWASVEPVDVLTGGYPCQPFSHAGKRKGTNDERHLWPYVRDAIRVLRPRITVLENVRGHLTLGFDTVLADLAELGMSARWGIVRAADAGSPHGRARLFIVVTDADGQGLQGRRTGAADAGRSRARGTAAGHRRELPADPDGSGRPEDVQQPSNLGTAATEGQPSLADGHRADRHAAAGPAALAAAHSVSERHDGLGDCRGEGCAQCGRADAAGHPGAAANPDRDGHGRELHARGVGSLEGEAAGGAPERQRARRESDAGGDLATADAARRGSAAQRASGPSEAGAAAGADGGCEYGVGTAADAASAERRGAERAPVGPTTGPAAEPGERDSTDWGKYAPAIHRWERVLGRPAPSPTIPGANGRPRLSPAFVEWMMGLPAGHVTGHGLRPAQELKMLGNGVVPQQAALALRMLGVAP